MSIADKSKIVIIGAGNVGEAVCYTLMVRRQASEIVLVDINGDRAEGSALDIVHGTAFFHQVKVRNGGYEDCADAQIIILTAGVARKPGQTRLDLAKTNVSITRDIARRIMQYAVNPILVVVSNPVDVLTYVVQQETGLPANRVIGSGTSLDTARFRQMIGEACGVDVSNVTAYILGEHGDSQVPVWSSATVAGEPVDAFYQSQKGRDLDHAGIAERTKNAGGTVIKLKGATFYGVAMSTSRIVEAICEDENSVLPVAHVLGEKFGPLQNVAISLPCVINREGIARVVRPVMNEAETQALTRSAETLRTFMDQALTE